MSQLVLCFHYKMYVALKMASIKVIKLNLILHVFQMLYLRFHYDFGMPAPETHFQCRLSYVLQSLILDYTVLLLLVTTIIGRYGMESGIWLASSYQ